MPLGPSPHLAWSELACHDALRSAYPLDWRQDRGRILGQAFEDVRAECGLEAGCTVPLTVLEGYRTQAYQEMLRKNPRYRAALRSQHCEGRAIDIACPLRFLTFDQFEASVKRAASREDSPIRYIELRPSMMYVHIDVRPTQRLVTETIP